jgi:hypothetical protein
MTQLVGSLLNRPDELSRSELSRYCARCGEERAFEQFHADPAGCPDAPDGDCPEWGCTSCGDALIIGLPAAGDGGDRVIRAA